MTGYRTESYLITQPSQIEQYWLDLQGRADCSYFQSWGWVGTWLAQIAIDLQPIVVKVWSDENLIGMGLFVSRNIRRHYIIHSKAMFLNEYPFDNKNMVIEYNGLLAQRGYEEIVYSEIVGYLLREYREYDEYHFGAIAGDKSLVSLEKCASDSVDFIINEESIAWRVDLSGLAPGLDAYLASLSKNRRGQIRRSLRLYEEEGPIKLDEARDTEEALLFFDGLKVLHTERWHLKGERGVFANPQWESFHRALIEARFEEGEMQILKVANSHSTIGYLYNFVWRNTVYVLQTGFRVSADKRLMPGYVVHALAIVHNKVEGRAAYDLMHGDSLYKRISCSQSHKLYWATLQRHRIKFGFERLMVGLVRRYRKVSA